MTSQQRVMAAFDHRPPDRIPVDYWALNEVTERVQKALGVTGYEQLLTRLGVDLRNVRGSVKYVGP